MLPGLVAYDDSDKSEESGSDNDVGQEAVEEELKMRIPHSAKTENGRTAMQRQQWEDRLKKFKEIQTGKPSNHVDKDNKTYVDLLSIPSLDTMYSSEDEEEEQTGSSSGPALPPAKKKPRIVDKNAGLLSLLPQPSSMIVKEGSSRLLMVPDSVSRRPKRVSSKPAPQTVVPRIAPVMHEATAEEEDMEESAGSSYFSYVPTPDQTASMELPSLLTAAVPASAVQGPRLPPPSAIPATLPDYPTSSAFTPSSEMAYVAPLPKVPVWPRAKHPRDMPKEGEIIDIYQEDLVAGAKVELTKALTQDDPESQGYMRPDPEDMPGKTAARKHQITWLAFKAKEREFDLQNSWADSRFTKNQTRSKYGF